jgi:hypothetical protein
LKIAGPRQAMLAKTVWDSVLQQGVRQAPPIIQQGGQYVSEYRKNFSSNLPQPRPTPTLGPGGAITYWSHQETRDCALPPSKALFKKNTMFTCPVEERNFQEK